LYVSTLTELNENSTLQIMDATGKILIEQKYKENPQMIDIKALKVGLYTINVTTASGSEQYRFVKEE
jgi:hypothetical protein